MKISLTRGAVALGLSLVMSCASKAPAPATPTGVAAPVADMKVPAPTGLGDTTPLTVESLEAFMRARFATLVSTGVMELGYPSSSSEAEIMAELACFSLKSTADIAALVPSDFDQRGIPVLAKSPSGATGILGLLRDFMIIKDAKHYFADCWQSHFSGTVEEFPLPMEYGVTPETLRGYLQP